MNYLTDQLSSGRGSERIQPGHAPCYCWNSTQTGFVRDAPGSGYSEAYLQGHSAEPLDQHWLGYSREPSSSILEHLDLSTNSTEQRGGPVQVVVAVVAERGIP